MNCVTCGSVISKERIEACKELGMGMPEECISCARKKPVNLYLSVHDSKHASTAEIVVVDTTKGADHVKRMGDFFRRGAQHCTAG